MNRYEKHLEDERALAETAIAEEEASKVTMIHEHRPMTHPLDWAWRDHKGVPREHGLEEFRDGNVATSIVGNPGLIHDLAPSIRRHLFGKSPNTHDLLLFTLRTFWRFLTHAQEKEIKLIVKSLKDIDDDVAALYLSELRSAVTSGASTEQRGIFQWRGFCRLMSRAQCNIRTWPDWPPSRRMAVHKDVPPRAVKYFYEAAKRTLSEGRARHSAGQAILDRFERASGLVELTKAHLPGEYRSFGPEWNEPNNILFTVHRRFQARLRGIVISREVPAVDKGINQAIKRLGYIDGVPGFSALATQSELWSLFAPTSLEAVAALTLVTAETGWVDTARAIDVSSDDWFREGRRQTVQKRSGRTVEITEMIISGPEITYEYDVPSEAELSAIRPKTRRLHQTRSLMQSEKGFRAFAVIKYMVERTRLLREIVKEELATLRRMPAPPAEHLRRIAELDEQVRCPWLFFPARGKGNPTGFTPSGGDIVMQPFNDLKELAIAEAVRRGETLEVIEGIGSLTPSDFRDAYAAWIYNRTGNDIFAVQAALNHRGINTTRRYLRQRSQIRERFAGCARVMEAGFDEAQAGRTIDPTILRLAADRTGQVVSKEDRKFLAAFRSACGARCVDPTNPPEEIEPKSERVEGELCGSQRCGLCRHARFDKGSLRGIAVRIAELKALSTVTPTERWLLSVYPVELEALELLVEEKFVDYVAHVWGWVREHRKRLEQSNELVFGAISVEAASALIGMNQAEVTK